MIAKSRQKGSRRARDSQLRLTEIELADGRSVGACRQGCCPAPSLLGGLSRWHGTGSAHAPVSAMCAPSELVQIVVCGADWLRWCVDGLGFVRVRPFRRCAPLRNWCGLSFVVLIGRGGVWTARAQCRCACFGDVRLFGRGADRRLWCGLAAVVRRRPGVCAGAPVSAMCASSELVRIVVCGADRLRWCVDGLGCAFLRQFWIGTERVTGSVLRPIGAPIRGLNLGCRVRH